ncbi:MAG: hypothetical protein A2381_20155 [Bdellovibrionales bacterium RIFOXYB1_FULL_37_110]|nr:MAG: hypothetical protein A2181_03790 [Bdellovibrionales bacterium RIFOXYA1_FULL_38_20]OFZ51050.1 MAG: hypothetical protein A2417_19940 [Bdellovibrionales bacterium RIFOXYC1_FULL_37_79]OFZ60262.1 MAG: hypothetical protein A2381_20155 [Bdellovibrionales bacterium RIFOXYB1_FULL_37_110]OFZ63257.1 MAG: hypothetical protein A2577_01470 [Bdellovibrionales bacterium RIFOXYD1_FULL_36_51]OFZ67551.1 MAG: hypothetical protein A2328_08275 [Bdellovibrionales bacterium RIFOXYB2_FULL_36_6]
MKKILNLKILAHKKTLLTLLIFHFLLYIFFGWWKSDIPKFEINQGGANGASNTIHFVKTLNSLIQNELEHGWLPNDFFLSPTKLLIDNRPNFQIGVLTIIRHSVRVLRDNLSRQRTTDEINPFVNKAFSYISNDYEKLLLPSFESRMHETIDHLDIFLKNYEANLASANYYPRSDNLIQVFDQYISELGSLNNKLLSGDTSFFSSDDLFYLVKGTNYALYSVLHAILKDFKTVLEEKKCMPLIQETISRIKQSDFDPIIVVSGDNESLLANHLIQLAGITSDVRQKLKSLNVMLDKN